MRAIVFVLQGCPAGWIGAYGNEVVATPHLDQLSAEGILFDRHISDCPEPCAARRALTGSNRDAAPALVAALRRAHVQTAIVRANHPDTDAPGWFYDGWDEVFDARPRTEDASPLDALLQAFPALLIRLEAYTDFLVWVEIDRLLPPWEVPQEVFEAYLSEDDGEGSEAGEPGSPTPGPASANVEPDDGEPDTEEAGIDEDSPDDEFRSPVIEEPVAPWSDPPTGPFDPADPDARDWLYFSFAAVVSRLDAELGYLFDRLREHRLDQTATWIVTSDFGLPLGEHGQIGLHRPWLYEELVHLPLILRLPGAVESCRRIGSFTQPPDVATTLFDLFGLQPVVQGHSLLLQARGVGGAARSVAISSLELGPAAELAVRTAGWTYIKPVRVPDGEVRPPQLFVRPDDRWEMNNVYGHNADRAEELEKLIGTPADPA